MKITAGMDDDWFEKDQLHFAAQEGYLAKVKELLDQGHPTNAFDDLEHFHLLCVSDM